MNKKMREIFAKMEQKRLMAEGFMEEGENKDLSKAKSLLSEVKELQKEFELQKELFESKKAQGEPTTTQIKGLNDGEISGFGVIGKMLNKKSLTEAEKNLIVGGENGEDLLVPQDVRTAIRELRRSHVSLKDIVNVIPVTTLSGSTNYEVDENRTGKLTKLTEDGQEIPASSGPKFVAKPWKVDEYGDFIPVSRVLLGNEKAQLMAYLNKWFVRKAINSENDEILTTLKAGKTPKALVGWEAFKNSINKDLDPASLIGGVIVTNQTGFNILDRAKDADGRPILQPNPAESTKKIFQSLNITVLSDAQFPNVSGKAPVIYGNTKEGCDFMDRDSLKMDVSEHFLFNKNMNCLRVIEMFDTVQTDSGAYMYGTLEEAPATLSMSNENE